MKIELITTGTELLTGEVLNTHVGAIGERLEAVGLQLERQTSVPDGGAVESAMAEASSRADVVLVTGGLGPTPDDVTREAAARLRRAVLLLDPELVGRLEAYFAERAMQMAPANRRQAYVPVGAEVLPNDRGTAPGLYLPAAPWGGQPTCHLILLPGPPREMLPMFERQVLPMLQRLAGDEPNGRGQQTLRVMGLGESEVVQRLGEDFEQAHEVTLAYCIGEGDISLRLSGDAGRVSAAAGAAADKLGAQLVSERGQTIAEVVVAALGQRGETVTLAESCTGGGIAARLTAVAGASEVFRGGWITYANETKGTQLGVEASLLQRHGAVSSEVAAAMATGALKRAAADWALAVTGIAGPGGGSAEKPVGTVHIALAGRSLAQPQLVHRVFRGDRDRVRMLTGQHALDLLRLALREAPAPGEVPIQPLAEPRAAAVATEPAARRALISSASPTEPLTEPAPAPPATPATPAPGPEVGPDREEPENPLEPPAESKPTATRPAPAPSAPPAPTSPVSESGSPAPKPQPKAMPGRKPAAAPLIKPERAAPSAPLAGPGQAGAADPTPPPAVDRLGMPPRFGARPLARPRGRPLRRPLKVPLPGAERAEMPGDD